ncbi:hypothetical protein CP8484711_2130B, partial [Chlamydia psittaci 84-8471/1]
PAANNLPKLSTATATVRQPKQIKQ